MPTALFKGLSAFPLTPISDDGIVDTNVLGMLVDRLAIAGVDSIGLLGSTGIYAYLDRHERLRAIAAAIEAANGRVPLIVGIGALRTDWAKQYACDAEQQGAAGLLLAPVSYTPLTADEVAGHYECVASATALPLCIYNNPGTTHFTFTDDLIARLSVTKGVASVKMPLPTDGDFIGEMSRVRNSSNPDFAIGYSGDWGAAHALIAGADAWYSVIAGLLPNPALQLTHAAQAGMDSEVDALNIAFEPLWVLFKQYGSLRVMYAVAIQLGLPVGDPPLPIQRVPESIEETVAKAIEGLAVCSLAICGMAQK